LAIRASIKFRFQLLANDVSIRSGTALPSFFQAVKAMICLYRLPERAYPSRLKTRPVMACSHFPHSRGNLPTLIPGQGTSLPKAASFGPLERTWDFPFQDDPLPASFNLRVKNGYGM